jgi:cytochrome P450
LPAAVQGLLFGLWFERFSGALHARFGPTVTLRIPGFPAVVISCDRAVAREVFTGDPLAKRHGNDALRPLVGDRSVMVLEPESHLERRKLLLPSFRGQRLAGYSELMQLLVEQELASWPGRGTIVVHRRAQVLTLEVIMQAVLGISDPGTRVRLADVFEAMLRPVTMLRLSISSSGGPRAHRIARPYWRLRKQLDAILYAQIASSRSHPSLEQREDVLALLIQARDETGAGLSDEELRDELATLIAAGYETTATAIAWGVDLLAHNPEAHARAREGVSGGDDAYLGALVKEILRIRPPVPVAAARHPVAPVRIGGWTVQPQHLILINAWAIHHDPSLYPHPEEFRPERFLITAPEPYALIPFGGGAHRCLGAALAELEISIFLRALLIRLDVTAVTTRAERSRRRSTTLSPRHGTRIQANDRGA